MMPHKFAVGIVVKNRWDLTHKTLQSLYHTDQLKDSYDLYIINNASDSSTTADLKEWSKSAIVPVKNLITINDVGIGPAWNLFLVLTAEYPYRTKLDNDLVFANTPVAEKPFERETRTSRPANPGDAGVNPGATPIASIQMGAGKRVQKKMDQNHTCFLQHMEDTIRDNKLGICALPPVSIGQTLADTMPNLGNKRWREMPVLVGGCMTITKSTFETLGYFDDALPCNIDLEYSQRAMAQGINVGYTPDYCIIHLGESDPTMSAPLKQQSELAAKMLGSQIPVKRNFVHTKWEPVAPKILKAAAQNMIINLT
ncbi:MAG: glycosyltransferase family 2 protein [Promethearchaeota archaeon]|jgi:GT2 family glycosyltransferase